MDNLVQAGEIPACQALQGDYTKDEIITGGSQPVPDTQQVIYEFRERSALTEHAFLLYYNIFFRPMAADIEIIQVYQRRFYYAVIEGLDPWAQQPERL